MAKLSPADQKVAALLAQEAGVASPVKIEEPAEEDDAHARQTIVPIDTTAPARPLGENDIRVGSTSKGEPVGIDLPKLIDGRLLIQGNSGAGKSMLLRRLFEQAFGRVQQLLIDPDGEFSTLKEHFDVAVLTAADIRRVGGHAFAQHLREHRYSAVLDLSDATAEDRLDLVADLAEGLMLVGEAYWHPLLVLIDEAQTLAPHYDTGDVTADTRKRSTAMLADVMGRGRKRGIAGVIATQRLAETAKAVVSKATNIVVGRTIFDRDLERAGSLLGFTLGHSRALRTLADGEFLAIGPAIAGPRRVRFKAGAVLSRHKGAAPVVIAPPTISAADAAAMLMAVPDARKETPAAAVEPDTTTNNRRGWSESDDAIVRDSFTKGLKLSQVAALLIANGGAARSLGAISVRGQTLGIKNTRTVGGWTDEEYQFVLDGYEAGAAIADIRKSLTAAGFDRSFGAIQMAAIKLGVSGSRVNLWTEEETRIALAGLAAGKTHTDVLLDLKAAGYIRGPTALHKFSTKHGVVRKRDAYTEAENEIIRARKAEGKSVKEICAELGRTESSVAAQSSKLGIKQRRPWTEEERQILVDYQAEGKKLKEAAERIGRPYANVAAEAHRMGVSFLKPTAERTPT
ncbi:helicase HerA domain-containing protein [Mesorhizobium sp. 128a]